MKPCDTRKFASEGQDPSESRALAKSAAAEQRLAKNGAAGSLGP